MKARESKSSWRRWLMAPLLVGLAMGLTACKPASKSGGSTVGIYNPGCPGCVPGPAGTGTVLAAAIGSRTDSSQLIELGLRVHAPNAGIPAYAYYGPVTATGYVMIESANWGGCTIMPLGYYQIQTPVVNGSYAPDYSYQTFNLMNFDFDVVHTSGFRARFHVNYAEFYDQAIVVGADGGQYPHRLYGEIVITPVTSAPGCYVAPVKLFFPKPY